MFSRKGWGGAVDPFILTKFVKPEDIPEDQDPVVSLVMFEWSDRDYVGKLMDDTTSTRAYICDATAIEAKFCNTTEEGEFILSQDSDKSKSMIITQAIHLKNPPAINYPIKRTGYYCVGTYGYTAEEYKGIVEFRNSYGELPAAQIAKLPFYGALTLVYALASAGWAFLYFQNRHDILPVQNYITAILVFLVIEIFMTWLFYDFQNRHGLSTGAKALLIVVSVLSAGRNSFSFFLLLIVCMGYGVVKPSLGRTMIWVRWLAITHFVFGVVYVIASLSVTPENAGPLVLLVVLPLAATLTAFYIWTLNSLNATMKDLMERKQTIKAMMYRKLWWCILGSIIVIFVFFFVNSWTFAGVSDEDFVPTHWSSRWFILDGWLNLVYLADVAFVAWLWRPTANNRRFAMSDEVCDPNSLQPFHMLTFLSRLLKTMRASRLQACAHLLTLMTPTSKAHRPPMMLPETTLRVPTPTVMHHLCQHPSRRNMHPYPESLWMVRRYLQSVERMMMTRGGVKMTVTMRASI